MEGRKKVLITQNSVEEYWCVQSGASVSTSSTKCDCHRKCCMMSPLYMYIHVAKL